MRLGPRLAKKGNYPGAVAVELRQLSKVLVDVSAAVTELAEILENIPRFEEWKKGAKGQGMKGK